MKGDTMYSWMKGDKCTAGCNQTMHRYTNIQVQGTYIQCMITIYRIQIYSAQIYSIGCTIYRLQITVHDYGKSLTGFDEIAEADTLCPC